LFVKDKLQILLTRSENINNRKLLATFYIKYITEKLVTYHQNAV